MTDTTHRIAGHDGVGLFVRDSGSADAPALVLIHGWSQHHLCWLRQAPLSDRFRLIAFDLRGHGGSDKPDKPAAYEDTEVWAGDVAAVIDALDLDNPILVGWSMGGRVIGDYLSAYGDGAIAGAVTIGSPAAGGRFAPAEGMALRSDAVNAVDAYSEDPAIALPAIIAFLKECTARPLPADELAFFTGLNMLATPLARKVSRLREYDHRPAWGAMTKPVMLIQGAQEKLAVPPNFQQMVDALNDPLIHMYEDDGHMAFWESPERFNRDLAAFADRAFGREG